MFAKPDDAQAKVLFPNLRREAFVCFRVACLAGLSVEFGRGTGISETCTNVVIAIKKPILGSKDYM